MVIRGMVYYCYTNIIGDISNKQLKAMSKSPKRDIDHPLHEKLLIYCTSWFINPN